MYLTLLVISVLTCVTFCNHSALPSPQTATGKCWASGTERKSYLVGAPLECMRVDVLSPFPHTKTMDYFTKWPKVYEVPDQSTTTTVAKLPKELHSDQQRNFKARAFGEVCWWLDIVKTRTIPLHPQSDRPTERFHCTLATSLAILVDEHSATGTSTFHWSSEHIAQQGRKVPATTPLPSCLAVSCEP